MYQLIQDDECHWYVIPSDMTEMFYQWIRDENDGVDSEFDFNDCRVDGPHAVSFKDWTIV